jgi:hypothetical protein
LIKNSKAVVFPCLQRQPDCSRKQKRVDNCLLKQLGCRS